MIWKNERSQTGEQSQGQEKDSGVAGRRYCLFGRGVASGYHEKQLQVKACDWPQGDDQEVQAGLGTLRNWKLNQEGENREEVCVDVVERELHKHGPGPTKTHTHAKREQT